MSIIIINVTAVIKKFVFFKTIHNLQQESLSKLRQVGQQFLLWTV